MLIGSFFVITIFYSLSDAMQTLHSILEGVMNVSSKVGTEIYLIFCSCGSCSEHHREDIHYHFYSKIRSEVTSLMHYSATIYWQWQLLQLRQCQKHTPFANIHPSQVCERVLLQLGESPPYTLLPL